MTVINNVIEDFKVWWPSYLAVILIFKGLYIFGGDNDIVKLFIYEFTGIAFLFIQIFKIPDEEEEY